MNRFLSLLLLCLCGPLSGFADQPAILLRAGFPLYAFAGVDPGDAEVSTGFYMKALTESSGLTYSSKLYQSRQDLHADMIGGKVDFALTTPLDLMNPEIDALFEPILCPIRGEVAQEHLVLLVHRDSAIRSLADMKDKRVLVFSGADSELESAWMDRELKAVGLPSHKIHFKSIEYPQGAGKTILPVFFKKTDACVVSESLLDTVSRLNPQVEKRLVPIIRSESLLTTFLCIRKDYSPEGRQRLIHVALTLGDQEEGRQVLTLTKIDGLCRYDPKTLEPSLALLKGLPSPLPAPPVAPALTRAVP